MAKNRKNKAKRYGESKSREYHDTKLCNLLGVEKKDLSATIAKLYFSEINRKNPYIVF